VIQLDKNAMERYRQEMMRLYGKSTSKNDAVPVNVNFSETRQKETDISYRKEDEIIQESFHETQEANQDYPPETVPEDTNIDADINNNTDIDKPFQNTQKETIRKVSPTSKPKPEKLSIDERYPDPVLDEIMKNPHTKFNNNEYNKRNKYNSLGWISVDVRTGENSSPIEGASVIITSIADGNLIFKATGVTDESGQIKKIALPAPSASLSLDSENLIKPYSIYDISVYADGFFRERSVDVPVFAGITSVQQFDMVPLPLYMSENDETITYYNQEPELQ